MFYPDRVSFSSEYSLCFLQTEPLFHPNKGSVLFQLKLRFAFMKPAASPPAN
ncbi:hypothetical protein JCM10003_3683 [Bacteroides pyogenes JCM 10003]|nr:hypothetical protein JCM10003_3683 [Bacteroides pyogenes JCM 10003]